MTETAIRLPETLQERLVARFLRYIQIDTQSDPSSDTYPSTARQLRLLNLLVEELSLIGLHDVQIDPYG